MSKSPAAMPSGRSSAEPRYLTVGVSPAICREAGAPAARYRLRGYDSVHLASYLEVARAAGAADTRFSSFDDRLNRAARAAGRTLRASEHRFTSLRPSAWPLVAPVHQAALA